MNKMLTPQVMGAFRHLLTAVGPMLAANGWTTDAEWQIAVGIVMAVLGFLASWYAPEKK